MTGRRPSGRLALALCLAVVVVAGCGNHAKPTTHPVTRSGSPTASASATATPTQTRPAKQPTVKISVPAQLRNPGDPNREILGGDISWPQCPKGMGIKYKQGLGAPLPLPSAKYVVLGLTNGPGFYPNPCLASQVAWVKQRRLLAAAYSVVSYPSSSQLSTYGGKGPFGTGSLVDRLRNVGYQQAQFNVATMRRAGLGSPIVWIDVEPVPHYDWPADLTRNAAIVFGAARGYRDAGLTVGVYSTPALWKRVVGDLRLGVPEWRAAGQTSRAEARRRCATSWIIQGGVSVLSQWVEAGRDQNITCPGTAGQMLAWFHQY